MAEPLNSARLLPRPHKGLVDGFDCFGPSLGHRQGAGASEEAKILPSFGGENPPAPFFFRVLGFFFNA